MRKKIIVIGILITLLMTSCIGTNALKTKKETENKTLEKNQNSISNNNFWKHKDVTQYDITNDYNLFHPERVSYGTAYNYNGFSIISSGDSSFDPWIVWMDEDRGKSGSFEFKDLKTSDHSGFTVQIDKDGYIWATCGGYAHIEPLDLYKSKTSYCTTDYTGYDLLLDNYATGNGQLCPTVIVLGDKVNLFYRNGPNDTPSTGTQQKQYSKYDFSEPLINREILLGEMVYGSSITPCYTWARVDPRYNCGFLTLSYQWNHKKSACFGSFPYIRVTTGGNTLVNGKGDSYTFPIKYSKNADIPLDGIKDGINSRSGGPNLGITPSGKSYMLVNQYYNPADFYLYVKESYGWNKIWEKTIDNEFAVACGVTKDYLVLLYGVDNEIFVKVSKNDGKTWSDDTLIVRETDNLVTGIAFAQPALNYKNNIIRFFYGTGSAVSTKPNSKYSFLKFDASDFMINDNNNAPSIPEILSGPTNGEPMIEYTYTARSTDSDNDKIQYCFNWGDDKTTWTDPIKSGQTATASHTWENNGEYQILVKARDEHGKESGWSQPVTVEILNSPPLQPEKPSGKQKGQTGAPYDYTTSTTDPNNDNVKYGWDWNNDGIVDEWTTFYPSGQPVTTSHSWDSEGEYQVKVKAEDENGEQSTWSDALKVSMPKTKTPKSLCKIINDVIPINIKKDNNFLESYTLESNSGGYGPFIDDAWTQEFSIVSINEVNNGPFAKGGCLGENGYTTAEGTIACTANNGYIFYRISGSMGGDFTYCDNYYKVSHDNGKTWSALYPFLDGVRGFPDNCRVSGTWVVDKNDRLWVLVTIDQGFSSAYVYAIYSDNYGKSWVGLDSEYFVDTSKGAINVTAQTNIRNEMIKDCGQKYTRCGAFCNGIRCENGRLIVPSYCAVSYTDSLIYAFLCDNPEAGKNAKWENTRAFAHPSPEASAWSVVELENNNGLATIRTTSGTGARKGSWIEKLDDGTGRTSSGMGTFVMSEPFFSMADDPETEGNIHRLSKDRYWGRYGGEYEKNRIVLLWNDQTSSKVYTHLTATISYDEGKTWSRFKDLSSSNKWAGCRLTVAKNDNILLSYNKFSSGGFVSAMRLCNLEWLTDGWDRFNHIGNVLTAEIKGPDYFLPNLETQFHGYAYGGYPPYTYSWDFDADDGIQIDSTEQNPTHIFDMKDSYIITLKVKDDHGKSDTTTFQITVNKPPSAPSVNGKKRGNPEEMYEFYISSTDPENDEIYYWIEWGDENIEEWDGPHPSGVQQTFGHSWVEEGIYNIKVKAKDDYCSESDWSTYQISMPKEKQMAKNSLIQLLNRLIPNLTVFFQAIQRQLFS